MRDVRTTFQDVGRTFGDTELGKGRMALHSAGPAGCGTNMAYGLYAGYSQATTGSGDFRPCRSSVFDSIEANDSELLGETDCQQGAGFLDVLEGGAAPDVLARTPAGSRLPPSVLELLAVTNTLWEFQDPVFGEPSLGADAELPDGAVDADAESWREALLRAAEQATESHDTSLPRIIEPTQRSSPLATLKASQQEEGLTSDIDFDTECESDPEEPISDSEGEPTTVLVGPTPLASQPYQLDQVYIPGPEGKVAIRSSARQLVLSDALRLTMAWDQVPLSFGSAVHLAHGASPGCRPCMYERWAGRCSKRWLCDFCHMHVGTKRGRNKSTRTSDFMQVAQPSTTYFGSGYRQPRSPAQPAFLRGERLSL